MPNWVLFALVWLFARTIVETMMVAPLVAKFQVRNYPTMILLDENGQVIARGEGAQLQQIEAQIQQRLTRR